MTDGATIFKEARRESLNVMKIYENKRVLRDTSEGAAEKERFPVFNLYKSIRLQPALGLGDDFFLL